MNARWKRWTTGITLLLSLFLLIPLLVFGRSAQPMDPSLFPNETCKKCHTAAGPPKADYTKPECVECHSAPDDEGLRPVANTFATPRPAAPNDMISIPAGVFIIGDNGRSPSEGSGDPDETPEHKVYIDTYLIDKYEVTNAQYKAFVDATNHRTPNHWKSRSDNGPDPGMTYPPVKAHHPVVYVDWYDANDYCHWAGKRLPTEEEWEKAARGTDGRVFPWGNAFDAKKANTPQYWLSMNKDGDTMPVGSFESGRSPYGVYDMAGNVYEWTANWYKPYPRNAELNPHYGEKNKIVRGGSWYDCLSYGCGLSAPSYNRSRFAPEIRNKGFGFRCAKSR